MTDILDRTKIYVDGAWIEFHWQRVGSTFSIRLPKS